MKRKGNFPDPFSFSTGPVFLLSCFQLQRNSLTHSLGAVPKTQTTTSLECNEEEDKQTEGKWWRYGSMKNANEPKFNQERARGFLRQDHQVGACHTRLSKFGSNHYVEIFNNTEIFCSHHTTQLGTSETWMCRNRWGIQREKNGNRKYPAWWQIPTWIIKISLEQTARPSKLSPEARSQP